MRLRAPIIPTDRVVPTSSLAGLYRRYVLADIQLVPDAKRALYGHVKLVTGKPQRNSPPKEFQHDSTNHLPTHYYRGSVFAHDCRDTVRGALETSRR